MPYKRKTADEYRIEQYTGTYYGWEEVCAEETHTEAKARLTEYRANQPEYPARITKKRVQNTTGASHE